MTRDEEWYHAGMHFEEQNMIKYLFYQLKLIGAWAEAGHPMYDIVSIAAQSCGHVERNMPLLVINNFCSKELWRIADVLRYKEDIDTCTHAKDKG